MVYLVVYEDGNYYDILGVFDSIESAESYNKVNVFRNQSRIIEKEVM